MRDCLEEVCEDAQLKEQYFTSPIALQGNVGRSEETAFGGNRQPQFSNYQGSPYKGSKGGGKKGNKGKSKQRQTGKGSSEHSLVSFTDDNKQICFAYNAQGCTAVAIEFMFVVCVDVARHIRCGSTTKG